MSIENIKAKIIAEALEYSKEVLEEAQKSKDEILEEAQVKADKLKEKAQIKSEEEAELVMSRKRSVAALEVRKMKLQAKQDMVRRSFELALDKLADMEEEDYLDMLSTSILSIGGEGGELLLNEKDKARLGEKLIQKVNAGAKAGTFSLSEDVLDAKGGFVLKRGSTLVNSTLETMLNEIREATISQVVQLLYDSQGE